MGEANELGNSLIKKSILPQLFTKNNTGVMESKGKVVPEIKGSGSSDTHRVLFGNG